MPEPQPYRVNDEEQFVTVMKADGTPVKIAKTSLSQETLATLSGMPSAPAAQPEVAPTASLDKELDALSLTESSGGKNKAHKTITDPGSMHLGHTAGGAYGLMPNTVNERFRNSPELRKKYPKVWEKLKAFSVSDKLDAATADAITAEINKDANLDKDIARKAWGLARQGRDLGEAYAAWYAGRGSEKTRSGAYEYRDYVEGGKKAKPGRESRMKEIEDVVGNFMKNYGSVSPAVTAAEDGGMPGALPSRGTPLPAMARPGALTAQADAGMYDAQPEFVKQPVQAPQMPAAQPIAPQGMIPPAEAAGGAGDFEEAGSLLDDSLAPEPLGFRPMVAKPGGAPSITRSPLPAPAREITDEERGYLSPAEMQKRQVDEQSRIAQETEAVGGAVPQRILDEEQAATSAAQIADINRQRAVRGLPPVTSTGEPVAAGQAGQRAEEAVPSKAPEPAKSEYELELENLRTMQKDAAGRTVEARKRSAAAFDKFDKLREAGVKDTYWSNKPLWAKALAIMASGFQGFASGMHGGASGAQWMYDLAQQDLALQKSRIDEAGNAYQFVLADTKDEMDADATLIQLKLKELEAMAALFAKRGGAAGGGRIPATMVTRAENLQSGLAMLDDLEKQYEGLGAGAIISGRIPMQNAATAYDANLDQAMTDLIFSYSGKVVNLQEAARISRLLPKATSLETTGYGKQRFAAFRKAMMRKAQALDQQAQSVYGLSLVDLSPEQKSALPGSASFVSDLEDEFEADAPEEVE